MGGLVSDMEVLVAKLLPGSALHKSSAFSVFRNMRTRYRIVDESHPYFLTTTIIEWIPIFTRKKYSDIIIQSLKFCRENKQLELFAYVVMDNHIHLVASTNNISQFIQDFKSYTAKELLRQARSDNKLWLLNQFEYYKKKYKKDSSYQVWQEGAHPQMIFSGEVFRQKVEYIHNNPVRAGFVERPEHWIYSSASNYILGTGIIEIDIIQI